MVLVLAGRTSLNYLLFFLPLGPRYSFFRPGPDWEASLEQAAAHAAHLVAEIRPSRAQLLTPSPAMRRAFSNAGIRSGHASSLSQVAASLPGSIPSVLVNPFCIHLGAADVRGALDGWGPPRGPVCSIRAPIHHPLLFMEWGHNRLGRYLKTVECEAWSADGYTIDLKGKTAWFRRQNYPVVLTASNALTVATPSQWQSLDQHLRSGHFSPYPLEGVKAFDCSFREERLRAEALLSLSRVQRNLSDTPDRSGRRRLKHRAVT